MGGDFKCSQFTVMLLCFISCAFFIVGIATTEWFVRSGNQIIPSKYQPFGTNKVSRSERLGTNGLVREHYVISGDTGTTANPSPWTIVFDVNVDVWSDSCNIDGYRQTMAPTIGTIPDLSVGYCNYTTSGGWRTSCDVLDADYQLLKTNNAPQAMKDWSRWRYDISCKVSKANLSFWTISAFFVLLAAFVAMFASCSMLKSFATLLVIIISWVFIIVAFVLGTYLGAKAHDVGHCGAQTNMTNAANDAIVDVGFCEIGLSYFFTIGGMGGMILALVCAIITVLKDKKEERERPNKTRADPETAIPDENKNNNNENNANNNNNIVPSVDSHAIELNDYPLDERDRITPNRRDSPPPRRPRPSNSPHRYPPPQRYSPSPASRGQQYMMPRGGGPGGPPPPPFIDPNTGAPFYPPIPPHHRQQQPYPPPPGSINRRNSPPRFSGQQQQPPPFLQGGGPPHPPPYVSSTTPPRGSRQGNSPPRFQPVPPQNPADFTPPPHSAPPPSSSTPSRGYGNADAALGFMRNSNNNINNYNNINNNNNNNNSFNNNNNSYNNNNNTNNNDSYNNASGQSYRTGGAYFSDDSGVVNSSWVA